MGRPVPLLELAGLNAWYGHRRVLHEVDLCVEEGEIVAVLGARHGQRIRHSLMPREAIQHSRNL